MAAEIQELDTVRQASRTSVSVARETTTWPPCAIAINRAARFNEVP